MANNRHLLVRLCKLLDEHGFVHQHLVQKNGFSSALYSYGPAGVLLRKHILKTWWDNMVTTQENTFPVQSPTITCQVKRNASQVQNKPVCDPEPPEMKPTNLGEFRTNLSTDCDDHFNGIARLMNHRLPFSIVQTGLCYNQAPHRPESFLFDSVETTGVVLQHYCPPSTATQAFDRLLNHRLHWWRKLSGKPAEYKVETCKKDTDSGHRAEIQFMFPWGPETIETVVNRGQCLMKEREQSDNSYQFRHGRKTVVPHMVECSSILEQAMMTFCVDAYAEKQVFKVKAKTNDNKKLRTVLQLHSCLAPFHVSLASSGSRTRELQEVWKYVTRELQGGYLQVLHTQDGQSLETHFNRNDQLGIPFTVVVNDNTLDNGAVSVRNRDTTLKEQVHITQLKDSLLRYFR